ncbi:MAG: tetratricopeptide repeat protein [Vicinamibacterales bacterium]
MTRDDIVGRWPEAERLLDPLLDLPAPERRARALAACGGDTGLRQVVERLLDQAEADGEVPPLPGELFDTFPDAAPAVIGPYRVIEEIGHGGMSRVFRATREDSAVASPVALKLLDRRPTPAALRRFDRERDTLARLHHPHIARLLDGGITDEGTPYLVMELVDGEPIDDYCDRRSVDLAGRLRLFRQVLEAIEFAHARLIVHRDIKPANVFVDQHGAVKLLDFGIAKWLDETGGPALTQTIQRVMTPAHAAPEQFRGDPITAATDVYQLGLLLYRLLTGQPAHATEGSTHEAIARAVLDTDPDPPSEVVRRTQTAPHPVARRLAGDLDAIVLKALRKEPADRYPSVEALRRDLDDYLASRPVSARRGSLAYSLRKYASRHRAGVAAVTAATLALLIGFAGVLAQSRATAAERDRVRVAEARATAINTFLVRDLLAAATPAGAQGRTMSVDDVLANASRSVSYAFAGQPATEAEVRTTLADSYAALGRFAEAEAHAAAARDLLDRTAPRDEHAVLRARTLLARLALEQGRFDEARREAEAVLGAQKAAAGPASRDALATQAVLSRALRRQGELADAERLATEALAAATMHHPDDWRLGAELRNRLADVLIDLRRGVEAEPLTREALELRRARLGPTHPDVLGAMAQHALAVDAQLRFDEALTLSKEIVAASEAIYGLSHPQTARARNGLAMAHDRLGHDAEAREQVERALAIYRDTLGPEHADTLAVLRNLGILVGRMESPARAEPIYREVLDIRRRTLGPRHAQTIEAAIGLASLLARMPDNPGARAAALDVLRLCDGLAGGSGSDPRGLDSCATYLLEGAPPDLRSPLRARVLAERAVAAEGRGQDRRLQTLARAQRALGDHAGAMATMREALALPDALQSWTAEEVYVELMTAHGTPAGLEEWLLDRLERFRQKRGADDPLMAKTERHLALLYARTGRAVEAEERFRAVLTQLRKARPDTDLDVGRAMSELGGLLIDRGAYAEAEPLVVNGFASLIGDRRSGPLSRREARDRVVRLYEAWNRPADAARWRARPLAPDDQAAARP